jgi:outer membrane immunogenic protein
MRALFLSSVAFAALAGSAFAADLPSRKEAPIYVPPVPAFSWTGFYIGGDVGAAWATTGMNVNNYYTILPPLPAWRSQSLDSSGFMGGGYLGYNYQLNQNFVLGLEGDFQGTTNSKSVTWNSGPLVSDTVSSAYMMKSSLDWLAAINGRLGIAYDRALFYAIGGAAWAGASGSESVSVCCEVSWWRGYSQSKTLSGFDVGGGVEYAFTPNWLGRFEYRYYDFGNYNLNGYYNLNNRFNVFAPAAVGTSVNTVRVGLAYLFSAPAPVVAKY